MIISYRFDEDSYSTYTYEVEPNKVKEAIVEILCNLSKQSNKKLFEEFGNYQMAMYCVYDLDMADYFEEALKEELKEYFESEAYDEYCG